MNAKKPEISVIVPVYNAGEYLAPCIESVLRQTFTDFELLLVDDASTDSSLAVCRAFAATDPRVQVIPQPANLGVSAARNRGLDGAVGQYVTFLDADDSIHPRFLEILHQICEQRHCEIAVTRFQTVAATTHLNTPKESSTIASREITVYPACTAVEKALYQTGLTNCTWGMLYKCDLFSEYRFRNGRYEDLDSFYELFLSASRIAYVPTPMYFYTMNPGSYLHTFTPERAVVLDVTERIVDYMKANYPQLLPAAEDRALSAAFNIFNLLEENRCEAPEISERCKSTIRRYRRASLFNPKVRRKNKIGILVTYIGGFRLLKAIARMKKNS